MRNTDIKITKIQGCGNDMIMIDNRDKNIRLSSDQIAEICKRRFGVGSDGLILLEQSEKGDCFMNYFNKDGSIAPTGANAAKCTAHFLKTITNFE